MLEKLNTPKKLVKFWLNQKIKLCYLLKFFQCQLLKVIITTQWGKFIKIEINFYLYFYDINMKKKLVFKRKSLDSNKHILKAGI